MDTAKILVPAAQGNSKKAERENNTEKSGS
jgi:hypothetical protein